MKLPAGFIHLLKSKNKGTAMEVEVSELILCRDCVHSDPECTWCELVDMPIDEEHFCYWAEKEDKE